MLELPEGWRQVDTAEFGLPSTALTVVGPPGHRGQAPSLVVTTNPLDGQTWEAWASSVVETARANLSGVVLLDAAEIQYQGKDAAYILLTMVVDGHNLTQSQYLFAASTSAGEVGVQIVTTCSTANHPVLHSRLEQLALEINVDEVLS